jgi:hypothetical protein
LTGRERPSIPRASRRKGGRAHWPQPRRPRQAGHQAPPTGRQGRRTTRRYDLGGKHPRLQALGANGGLGRAHKRSPRQTAQAAREATCRQGLRLPAMPAIPSSPGHQGTHSPAGYREQREARSSPLGGGAESLVAIPLPKADGSLRAQGRHPPGFPRFGLLANLLQLSTRWVLKCALTRLVYKDEVLGRSRS